MTTVTAPNHPPAVLTLRVAGIVCWIWAALLLTFSIVAFLPPQPAFAFLPRASLINLGVAAALFAILYGIAGVGLRRGHLGASLLALLVATGYSLLIVLAHWPTFGVGLLVNLGIVALTVLGWAQVHHRGRHAAA